MRYLLDTHAMLWIADDNPKLSQKAKSLYLDEGNEIYLSLASLREIAIKVSLGKLSLDEPLEDFIDNHISSNDIEIMLLEPRHILPLASLPFHHNDPFDRAILAQAMVERIPIISKDSQFDSYSVQRIW